MPEEFFNLELIESTLSKRFCRVCLSRSDFSSGWDSLSLVGTVSKSSTLLWSVWSGWPRLIARDSILRLARVGAPGWRRSMACVSFWGESVYCASSSWSMPYVNLAKLSRLNDCNWLSYSCCLRVDGGMKLIELPLINLEDSTTLSAGVGVLFRTG